MRKRILSVVLTVLMLAAMVPSAMAATLEAVSYTHLDMAYAASRYTEVKLDGICEELFRDIDKDVVDFVPNYDGTLTEPVLLPTTFPNILVSANMGIAVGMASNLCGFNLTEVCEAAIARIRHPEACLLYTSRCV